MIFSFTVPGPPHGQGRPRFARMPRGVRTYKAPKDVSYERWIYAHALAARPRGWEPLTGPVALTVEVYQRVSKKQASRWSVTKPDLSNTIKAIEDALLGLGYVDDRQVSSIQACKWVVGKDAEPRVYVKVEAEQE